jgi:hypothetical protein
MQSDSSTKVRAHQWVMFTMTPIEVLDGGDGEPIVLVDPDKREAAEANSSYGCFACSQPLQDNLHTPCAGVESPN